MTAGRERELHDDLRVLAEASVWRVSLFEARVETSEAFETWVATNPRHATAWRQVCGPWERIGDSAMQPEMIVARRDALERARRQQQRRLGDRWTHRRAPGGRVAAFAAALVLLLALGSMTVWPLVRAEDYRTGRRERRALTLADGSRVTLDADTRLRVRLRRERRDLDLLQGQARFDVAHDAGRPFRVHAGDKTVVATGTSFDVDLHGAVAVVTLLQGGVSVLEDRPRQAPWTRAENRRPLARLTAGDQLVVPLSSGAHVALQDLAVTHRVSLERVTAWESGELVFDDTRLADAVEQMARYSSRTLKVDASAADLRLSGVFETGDSTAFVDAVQRALPVVAAADGTGALHLRRRGS